MKTWQRWTLEAFCATLLAAAIIGVVFLLTGCQTLCVEYVAQKYMDTLHQMKREEAWH